MDPVGLEAVAALEAGEEEEDAVAEDGEEEEDAEEELSSGATEEARALDVAEERASPVRARPLLLRRNTTITAVITVTTTAITRRRTGKSALADPGPSS